MNMDRSVFYVCYGSNLYFSRFKEYLDSALYRAYTPSHEDQWEELIMAHDKPVESYRVNLEHDIYYRGNSARWGGGIAYLDTDTRTCKKIYRAYKITRPQFASLFSQENGYFSEDQLNWGRILGEKETFTTAGFYDKIINLGKIDGVPALTFTSSTPKHQGSLSAPGDRYTEIINAGRQETKRLPYVDIHA